jgi:hypothetical protein
MLVSLQQDAAVVTATRHGLDGRRWSPLWLKIG